MFFGSKQSKQLAHCEQMLGQVLRAIQQLSVQLGGTVATLDDLKAQVQQTVGTEQSAITLITGLASKLAAIEAQMSASGADTTALVDLQNQLSTSATALAQAVSANPVPS